MEKMLSSFRKESGYERIEGTVTGTPYVSPEQAGGRPARSRKVGRLLPGRCALRDSDGEITYSAVTAYRIIGQVVAKGGKKKKKRDSELALEETSWLTRRLSTPL